MNSAPPLKGWRALCRITEKSGKIFIWCYINRKTYRIKLCIALLKTIFFILFFICVLFQGVQAADQQDDDFWLLLDYEPLQNVLWLYGGADELDGNYYGLTVDLALVEALHFNFSATEQNYSAETTDLRWGFSGAINRYFSWAILKTFWGKREVLEKNDIRFSLSSFYNGFIVRASYESGDVELFLRNSPLIRRDSISSDHQAYEIGAGYSWSYFYTQLSYKQHDYEKNLSLLFTRPRLFLAINPVGIQQASALAQTEAGILLGIPYEDMIYEIYISRIKSAVTEESNSYATLHLSKILSRQLELGFDVELPVNDVPFSAGLSLGIMW